MSGSNKVFAFYLVVMYGLPSLAFAGISVKLAYLLLPALVFILVVKGLVNRSLLSSLRLPTILFLSVYTFYLVVPYLINKPDLLSEATNFQLYWTTIVVFVVLFSDEVIGKDASMSDIDVFLAGVTRVLVVLGGFMVVVGLFEYVMPSVTRMFYSTGGAETGFGEREFGSLGMVARLSSAAGAPNTLGEIMSILSLLVLVDMVIVRDARRYLKFLFISFVVLMLMAASRGATVGFLAGVGVLLIINGRFKHIAVTIFVCLGIYLLAGDAIMGYFAQGYVAKSKGYVEGPASVAVRTKVWENAYEVLKQSDVEHLVFGNGFYNGRLYQTLGLHGWHNSFLQMVYAAGIVGATFFFLFLTFSLKRLLRALRRSRDISDLRSGYPYFVFVTVAYVSVLTHSLVDNIFFVNTVVMALFLPILCIAMAVSYKIERTVEAK